MLAKHGLVVWGDSAEEAYRRTIEVINQAVAFVNERTGDTERFGGRHPAADSAKPELLHELLPTIRGAVSSEKHKLLTVDTSERSLEFVSSADAEQLVTVGAPCPDHLVHTKRLPLWIPYDPETDDADALRARIVERAEQFRADYRAYVDEFRDDSTEPADPDPRIVLVQHLGLVSTGTTTKTSKVSRDLYHRAIEVMAGAHALDEFVSLDAGESFGIEYWPLELYKLAQAPPPGELQGRVALVTGGAGGIGRAIGDALADAGACVVAFDLDHDGASDAVEAYGDNGLAVSGDVTSEEAVAAAFAEAVDRYGGVDILVSNAGVASSAALEDTTLDEWHRNHDILVTGYFLVAREAFRILRKQDIGGSLVFIASKNALVAGKNAAAYSSAKAAELHLARCLAEEGGGAGIRVNTVNPDAVLQGSRIWGSSWREERAASYGIEPDELEEHYRKRTTLLVNIFPADIAQAVLHFASPARSGKSTGNLLNVDGGVPAAYARWLEPPADDPLGVDPDQRRRQRDRLAPPADLDPARVPRVGARQVVDHDRGASGPLHVAELLRRGELIAPDVDRVAHGVVDPRDRDDVRRPIRADRRDPPELPPPGQVAKLGLPEDAQGPRQPIASAGGWVRGWRHAGPL